MVALLAAGVGCGSADMAFEGEGYEYRIRREGEGASWNMWFEPYASTPGFEPLVRLEPETTYLLTVDLSALAYADEAGSLAAPVSAETLDWLGDQQGPSAALDILLLPEPGHFAPLANDEQLRPLTVDLERIRRMRTGFISLPDDAFAALRDDPTPPFTFGRVTFRVRTLDIVGWTSVALSVWVERRIPVDEVIFEVCVGSAESDCPSAAASPRGLRGIDAIRAATTPGEAPHPDVALQFAELRSGSVLGVLRCNRCSDWGENQFLTWDLGRSAAELSEFLDETLLDGLERASGALDRTTFRDIGGDLFNTLFREIGPDAEEAREAFIGFVAESLEARQEERSVFVRFLTPGADRSFMFPLGLMAVPVPGRDPVLLGLEFRVESPLWIQDYSGTDTCLSDWTALLPPRSTQDQALKAAREEMQAFVAALRAGGSLVMEDMRAFRNWLEPGEATEPSSGVLLILSHHERNQLYLDPNLRTPLVTSGTVRREFVSPSLAIINACGAASPGADDWILELNLRGVPAIIATSTTVDAQMAGRFMALMAENLTTDGEEGRRTLGWVVHEARLALSRSPAQDGEPYGPLALVYQLMGNSGLQVCSP